MYWRNQLFYCLDMEVQECSWKTFTIFVLSRSKMDQQSEGHGKEKEFYSLGHEASECHCWRGQLVVAGGKLECLGLALAKKG